MLPRAGKQQNPRPRSRSPPLSAPPSSPPLPSGPSAALWRASNGSRAPSALEEEEEESDSEENRESQGLGPHAREEEKEKRREGGGGNQGSRLGEPNYTAGEVRALLALVRERMPGSTQQWAQVAAIHNQDTTWPIRTGESCRRKFVRLSRSAGKAAGIAEREGDRGTGVRKGRERDRERGSTESRLIAEAHEIHQAIRDHYHALLNDTEEARVRPPPSRPVMAVAAGAEEVTEPRRASHFPVATEAMSPPPLPLPSPISPKSQAPSKRMKIEHEVKRADKRSEDAKPSDENTQLLLTTLLTQQMQQMQQQSQQHFMIMSAMFSKMLPSILPPSSSSSPAPLSFPLPPAVPSVSQPHPSPSPSLSPSSSQKPDARFPPSPASPRHPYLRSPSSYLDAIDYSSITARVKGTTAFAVSSSLSSSASSPTVRINFDALSRELHAHPHLYMRGSSSHSSSSSSSSAAASPALSWSTSHYHFFSPSLPSLTVQYIWVLDSLNYCFWPCERYEYEQLAGSIKMAVIRGRQRERERRKREGRKEQEEEANDMGILSAERLRGATAEAVRSLLTPPTPREIEWMKEHRFDDAATLSLPPHLIDREEQEEEGEAGRRRREVDIPLLASRVASLRELGTALLSPHFEFDGLAANVVNHANRSAESLLFLILSLLPSFRDVSLLDGVAIHLYKRAQILVGDLWGAFEGKGPGQFEDIDRLTCFADYRLPQLLRSIGIFEYSEELAKRIDEKKEIDSGSREEVIIRACTVQAVEEMKRIMREEKGVKINSIELDWILWERGEEQMNQLAPHHRVKTIYY